MDQEQSNQNLRKQFLEDGYVALPGFLNPQEVGELRENVERFIVDVAPTMPSEEVFYEDKTTKTTLKQLQQMFQYDDYFNNLMFGSKFEELAAKLLGHEVHGVNMQYFNKPPQVGLPTPPHQDGYYFMLEPNEAVTMWLALEDVDAENGCVRYVRHSHLQGLRPHGKTQTLGFSQGMTDFGTEEDIQNEIAFPAQPGDLLVHHALTVHRADGNTSKDRTRKALGFIYYSTAAQESEEKKLRHATLVEEMKSSGKV
ncbi:phytanoyl-CoA dioxygenase family protein [uncultured Gimesia sp.]|uniref:phytanoyl-CoA dioxygenase family protein n=1 Tax=uncultured Gimesia sp. TaxID=1678688 RepID=UPI0030DABAF7|tara:strand:- start:207221 stop:207985 length:765 start_codon:yes stop_codon:yes gene_type:complete